MVVSDITNCTVKVVVANCVPFVGSPCGKMVPSALQNGSSKVKVALLVCNEPREAVVFVATKYMLLGLSAEFIVCPKPIKN